MQPDTTLEPIKPCPTEIASFGNLCRWVGIGALTHAWLLGPAFDVHSLWSYGYVLAWPLPLAAWLLGWLGAALFWVGVGTIVILLLCFGYWALVEARAQWRVMRANAARARYED